MNKNQIKALELSDLVTNKMYEEKINSPVEIQSGSIKIGNIGNISNAYNKYNKNSDNNHVINERLLNSNVSVADILQSSLLKKNKSKQIINNQKINNQQSNNNGYDKIDGSFPYTNRDYEEEDISYKYYNQASNTNLINHSHLKGNEVKNKTTKKPVQNINQLIGNNYNQSKSKIYPNFVNTNIAQNVNDKEINQDNVNLARSGKFSIDEDPYYIGSNQTQNQNINNNQNQNQNLNNLKKNTNIKIKIDKEKENPKDIYSIYQNLMKTNTKNKVITNSLNNNSKINKENSKLLQNSTRK